jgi:hypothetical protein
MLEKKKILKYESENAKKVLGFPNLSGTSSRTFSTVHGWLLLFRELIGFSRWTLRIFS